jgi:spore coat protein U-like protein
MQAARLFAMFSLLGFSALAHAGAICWVEALNVRFGRLAEATARSIDSVVPVTVTCRGARGERVAYRIALNAARGGSAAERTMANGLGAQVGYNIYVDPGRTMVWGNGQGATTEITGQLTLEQTVATKRHLAYARIFGPQKTPVGDYTDSIAVTLTY